MTSRPLSTGASNGVKLAVGGEFEERIPNSMFPRTDGVVPTWEAATELFVETRKTEDQASLRFTNTWVDSVWHRLYEAHKEACFDGCTYFALLEFSGSYLLDGSDQLLSPVNYFHLLQQSKEARKKRLDRLLREWGASSHRIRIIGSDPRVKEELNDPVTYYDYDGRFDQHLYSQEHSILGYPREFLALYMSEDIPSAELYKVIDSHQNNCPIASEDERIAGDPLNKSVVDKYVWKYDEGPLRAKDKDSQTMIEMVARRIPTLADKITKFDEIPFRRQKTAAVIEAGNWRPVRRSTVLD